MAITYLPVSWKEYHTSSQKLAAALLSTDARYDEIIAISRGGLTLGHILSDLLQIPVFTLIIQSYTGLQEQGEVRITKELQSSITGKHILVVDDVADSGTTLVRALAYLDTADPTSVTTATLFYKPRSAFTPDYYARKTTDWIIFPYEVVEMITLVHKKMEKEGSSKKDIQSFLKTLGYTTSQIAFVRKHHLTP